MCIQKERERERERETCMYIPIHIHTYIQIHCGVYFVHLHKTIHRGTKGRCALVVPFPSKFETADYRQILNKNNNCFCGICSLGVLGNDLENRHVSSCASRHF